MMQVNIGHRRRRESSCCGARISEVSVDHCKWSRIPTYVNCRCAKWRRWPWGERFESWWTKHNGRRKIKSASERSRVQRVAVRNCVKTERRTQLASLYYQCVVQCNVKYDLPFLYGNVRFSTPSKIYTPKPIDMKLWRIDYIDEITSATFGWNLPVRGRSAQTWNICFLIKFC